MLAKSVFCSYTAHVSNNEPIFEEAMPEQVPIHEGVEFRLDTRNEKYAWAPLANCVDVNPDVFYPEKDDTIGERKAKQFCVNCIVRVNCLEYALENNEFQGVWGKKNEKERVKIVRRRMRFLGSL